MSRVFASGPGDRGSIPGRVIPKTQKWYLITPCLTHSIIRYVSRVNVAILGKEDPPNLHSSVVAIGKGSFRGHMTTVGLLTDMYNKVLKKREKKN